MNVHYQHTRYHSPWWRGKSTCSFRCCDSWESLYFGPLDRQSTRCPRNGSFDLCGRSTWGHASHSWCGIRSQEDDGIPAQQEHLFRQILASRPTASWIARPTQGCRASFPTRPWEHDENTKHSGKKWTTWQRQPCAPPRHRIWWYL